MTQSFAIIVQKIGRNWQATLPLQDAPPIVALSVNRTGAINSALADLEKYEINKEANHE